MQLRGRKTTNKAGLLAAFVLLVAMWLGLGYLNGQRAANVQGGVVLVSSGGTTFTPHEISAAVAVDDTVLVQELEKALPNLHKAVYDDSLQISFSGSMSGAPYYCVFDSGLIPAGEGSSLQTALPERAGNYALVISVPWESVEKCYYVFLLEISPGS